jgi:hypothetical protein
MIIFRWLGLCIICLSLSAQSSALEVAFAYNLFYLQTPQGPKPYVEVYWQIDNTKVGIKKQDDGTWLTKVKTSFSIVADTGVILNDAFVLQTPPAATVQQALSQNIIDLHRYSIPAGKVKMVLTLEDMQVEGNNFTHTDSVDATIEPAPTAFYSGLQLLDTSYASTTKNIFYKNDRANIPLSTNFIDDHRGMLHYYTELYDMNLLANATPPLVQKVFVSKKMFEAPVYDLLQTDTITPGQITPVLGSFDIRAQASGNYYLNIVLTDGKNERLASRAIFFQRSNKNPLEKIKAVDTSTGPQKINVLDLNSTFVGKFSIAELKAILKMIRPISTPGEQNTIDGFIKRPDEMYTRYFVYNYWKARGSDPKKAWEQYADKVREVNKLFSGGNARGYETERGQVYLKYGKPDERIVVMNEPGTLPYEVWQYNTPGKQSSQGIFLFYRPTYMVSDMILLHTTVNGELRNQQWRSLLYTGAASSTNSRAEQYLPQLTTNTTR